MAIPSNLYAEKIFSEHPIALWSLDEQVDYISLISENDRDFKTWTKSSNEITLTDAVRVDEPFPNAPTTEVLIDSETLTEIQLTGENLFPAINLNPDLKTFSIGAYFYADSPAITGVSIGYTYDGLAQPFIKNVNTQVTNRWFFISENFEVPDTTANIDIFIKIRFSRIEQISEYRFYLNGLTAGQWAENFHAVSLGVDNLGDIFPNPIEGLTDINNNLKFVPAKAYGISSLYGYYLSKDNKFLARNTSIPMVYGAENLTSLSPNNNLPSLIIPGLGFLNESGKFKEYTTEFWIRINPNTTSERKVFGPISSSDGLYVDGPFLTLKIDKYSQSYFVNDWYRPMLIDIRFVSGAVSLLVNGERVISFDIENKALNLASFVSESGKEQDWLGFYAYEDVPQVELDCIAIYPYSVPEVVAKRRFVYGQGVEYPENINTAYNGTSIYIDYQFANYANNYIYPDIGKWRQGAVENLNADNNTISFPNYPLPEVVTGNNSSTLLISDQTGSDYFTFYPNSNWQGVNSYLVFNNLDFIKTRIESIYGVFETTNINTRQNLFTILDPLTNNRLSIYIELDNIKYDFVFNNSTTTLSLEGYNSEIFADNKFRVGINFKQVAKTLGIQGSLFLNNIDRFQIYIGGTKDLTQTFKGKIYSVGIANERTLFEIKDLFNTYGIIENYENVFDQYFEENLPLFDGGTPTTETWELELNTSLEYNPASFKEINLSSYVPTYRLSPTQKYGKFLLDISATGYWQDYMPLSYFGKYVTDTRGDRIYTLDFIQANVSYPALDIFKTVDGVDYYDTSKSLAKFYVSFHDNQSKTITKPSNRKNVLLSSTKVITPTDNWRFEKYEFVNGSLIYMPPNINFNAVSISFHIELVNDSVTTKPLKIKQLHLGSLALSASVPANIGTKFGQQIYPYRKRGTYYTDYKKNNPFEIYKNSSPYLYLTKNSGIRLIDNDTSYEDRGIEIPINTGLSSSFKVIAFQSAVLYTQKKFSKNPVKIFEIRANQSLTKVYLVSSQEDDQRARIYAINGYTGGLQSGITFYINGKPALNPSININEWAMLGINFGNILDFTNTLGRLRISGPLLVNNLSYYQLDELQVIKKPVNRLWTEVKSFSGDPLEWSFWDPEKATDPGPLAQGRNWGEVLIISAENQYEINGKDIYNSFAGTNKIIVDDTQIDINNYNTNKFNFNSYEYNIITGALLESQTLKAV